MKDSQAIAIHPNSEVAGGGGSAEAAPECARSLGRSNGLLFSHRIVSNRSPIPRCCGRDGLALR